MVSIISLILGLIILGILYKNMIAWEGDYRISRGQALLPVLESGDFRHSAPGKNRQSQSN